MSVTIQVAIITAIIGPTLTIVLKQVLDRRRRRKDPVAEVLRTSSIVLSKLERIREEFHADRVYLSQFHNGGHFYPTGKSIAKFSVVYETVDVGVQSLQSSYQNIPVSLFSRSINQLLEHGTITIPNYKDETVATYGLRYAAEESNAKSSYYFAIKSIEDRFIGILCVDYTKKVTKLDHDTISELSSCAAVIGGVLHTHLTT